MKNGFFKKLVASAMALTMALGMATFAYAANTDAGLASATIKGKNVILGTVQEGTGSVVSVFSAWADDGSVTLLESEAATTDTTACTSVGVETTAPPTVEFYYFAPGATVTGDSDLITPFVAGTDAIEDGGFFIIKSISDTDNNTSYYKIAVTVNPDPRQPGKPGVTIKGVNANATVGTGAAAYAGVTKGSVALTELQAADTETEIVITVNEDDTASAILIKKADTEDADEADFDDGEEYVDQALENGDWIVIRVVYEAALNLDDEYYIIVVKASTKTSDQIEGDSDLFSVILQVTVPSSVDFRLDPHQISFDFTDAPTGGGTEKNQIAEENYYIKNETENAAVMVSFDLLVDLAEGVTLVDKKVETDATTKMIRDDRSFTDKNLIMGLMSAETGVTDSAASYDSGLADIVNYFDVKNKEGFIDFILGKQGASGTGVVTETAFSFYGELNRYADWAAGDITVSGAYTLTPMNTAMPEKLVTDNKVVTGSAGMLKFTAAERKPATAPAADVTLTAAAAAVSHDFVKSDHTSGEKFTILLTDGGTLNSVLIATSQQSLATYTAVYDEVTGLLDVTSIFNALSAGPARAFTFNTENGVYKVNITIK